MQVDNRWTLLFSNYVSLVKLDLLLLDGAALGDSESALAKRLICRGNKQSRIHSLGRLCGVSADPGEPEGSGLPVLCCTPHPILPPD